MRIVILYNPVSGAGRAAAAARQIAAALQAHGHASLALPTRLAPTGEWLDAALQADGGTDVLAVAGGDGAMRLAAPAACRNRAAVYHLPFGTENLFAREFAMKATPGQLLAAIERNQRRTIDVAVANGRWFLLMASVGFDAEVVHQLAQRRGTSISHLSYIAPILKSVRTWRPPVVRIVVDGQTLIDGEPGMTVIANSRQYGWRIDPAGRADMSDGLLDIVFLPARSLKDVMLWAWRCRRRKQFDHPRVRFARGRQAIVEADEAARFQLDGDPPGVVHEMLPEGLPAADHAALEQQAAGPLRLRAEVCPSRLEVLLPAVAGPR